MRSQNVTASKRNVRFLPWVFTEHGALMAANVLNSERAIQMCVELINAFIRLRAMALSVDELARRAVPSRLRRPAPTAQPAREVQAQDRLSRRRGRLLTRNRLVALAFARFCGLERHTRDDALDRLDRCLLRIDVVGDFLAAPQDDNTIDHLKHMVNIMCNKDTRVSGIAGVADEAQHALGLIDTEVVGWLIEDNQLTLEMHRAGNCDRLPLAARQRTDRSGRRNLFRDAHLFEQLDRPPRSSHSDPVDRRSAAP